MANTSSTIKNSWSLLAFAKMFGPKMQLGDFTNKETGEQFKSCVFTQNDDTRTFVAFSRKMGELSAKEIVAQKDKLQVVECTTESGKDMYCLCHTGESSWEDVNLF